MTNPVYQEIYDYLEATPGKRAHILPTDSGGWYLGGPTTNLRGISGPLKSLLSDHVPDGTQTVNLWLWLCNGKLRLSYSVPSGSLFTIDLIPGDI